MMLDIGPDNRCPVCGRFMKRTESEDRIMWECTNPAVDHDWDEE